MNLYIRLKNVPELKGLTVRQRSVVHRLCYQRYGFNSWKIWLALLFYGFCGGLGVVAGKILFLRFGLAFFPAMLIGTLAGAGVGFIIFRNIVIQHLRPFYAECIKEALQPPAAS